MTTVGILCFKISKNRLLVLPWIQDYGSIDCVSAIHIHKQVCTYHHCPEKGTKSNAIIFVFLRFSVYPCNKTGLN